MILHDKLGINEQVIVDYDRYGNPIYETVTTWYYGQVSPLSTDQTVDVGLTTIVVRYAAVLEPSALGPIQGLPAPPNRTLQWRGETYQVEGDAKQHTAQGKLHHIEIILKRVV